MPSDDDYKKADAMLFDVALGRPGGAAKELITDTIDDLGNSVRRIQRFAPDPKLLKELLSERIGGPQDWC